MSGPFRTPAKVERAPIPPHGHNEWHPRPELLNALDPSDAYILERNLETAREERFRSNADLVLSTWATAIVLWLAWRGFPFHWSPLHHAVVDAFGYGVLAYASVANTYRSRRSYVRARAFRDGAYQEAERALEAKLARDDRPRALRLITNLDAVQRALGVGTGDSADEQDGAA